MLRIIKVTGQSLSPSYQDGDYVVVTTLAPLVKKIHPGDLVVFSHPLHGRLIKIVERISGDDVYVRGTRDGSIDSRNFGPVARKNLTAKVIWHIKAPR